MFHLDYVSIEKSDIADVILMSLLSTLNEFHDSYENKYIHVNGKHGMENRVSLGATSILLFCNISSFSNHSNTQEKKGQLIITGPIHTDNSLIS